jgi:hypothetical protein
LVIDATGGLVNIGTLTSANSTQIQITESTGANAVTIKAINDSALTLIDASFAASGAVTLGSSSSYLSQNGLTILGGTGGTTAYTSGNGVIFTDLATGASSGGVGTVVSTIYATGNADVFNLKTAATSTAETIYAGGAGDIFNLTSAATSGSIGLSASLNGNYSSGGTNGLGANDVINYLAASATSNTNVDSVTIQLKGTVTGGNSAAYNFTTINNIQAVVANATLANQKLVFNNGSAGESYIGQVNVASATTLAGALDLAASTAALSFQSALGKAAGTMAINKGIIDWFEFGGNTYIVEANNGATAATHTALGATDVVVKLTGLVDLTGATFSGNTLTL